MSTVRFVAEVAGLDKAGYLAALAMAVGAPESFGGNWDALADGLQDLSWRPAAAYELALLGTSGLNADEQAIADEVFDDTARFWQAQGKSFRVIHTR